MKNGKMLPLGDFVLLLLFRAERVHLNRAGTAKKKKPKTQQTQRTQQKKPEQVAAGAFKVNSIR